MKEFFSVGEAAKAVNTTSETLRHYDRVGLVKPSQKDPCTKYRYYTKEDLIRLSTVRALQQMELSLKTIKEVLECDDLEKIVGFLSEAEKKADEKIADIEQSKAKISAAKSSYKNKLRAQKSAEIPTVKIFPERVILLSETLEKPSLDNLWNYLGHFYEKIPQELREEFLFEDLAGIYNENGCSRLFALCLRHADIKGLKTLPAGRYLCAFCSEEKRAETAAELIKTAEKEYEAAPAFTIEQVLVSGILQWKYEIQVYIEK